MGSGRVSEHSLLEVVEGIVSDFGPGVSGTMVRVRVTRSALALFTLCTRLDCLPACCRSRSFSRLSRPTACISMVWNSSKRVGHSSCQGTVLEVQALSLQCAVPAALRAMAMNIITECGGDARTALVRAACQ